MAIAARNQPQGLARINRSNTLARGLCVLIVPASGGNGFEAVSAQIGKTVGTLSAKQASPKGVSLGFAGAGSEYYSRTPNIESPTTEITWGYFGRRTGTVGQYARVLGKTANNGGGAPYDSYGFEVNSGGEGQNTFRAAISTVGGVNAVGPAYSGADLTVPHIALATWSAASATTTVFVNGKQVTSMAIGGSAVNYDTTTAGNLIVSGASAASVASTWIGDVYEVFVWSRVLSNAEIQSLTANPWQLFDVPSQSQFPQSSVLAQIVAAFRNFLHF